jgi:hypothetical protein
MHVRFHGALMVVWNGTERPLDEEWSEMIATMTRVAAECPTLLKLLVFTEGGAPTPSQQMQLARAIGGRPYPLAVVSDHLGVRFVASSIALFLKRIRTFRFEELPSAYAHLDLNEEQRKVAAEFVAEARRLGARLGTNF